MFITDSSKILWEEAKVRGKGRLLIIVEDRMESIGKAEEVKLWVK